jgi:hydroxymethylpyrimidine pyrophosphatase-like HAD family hydrolase
VPELLPNSDSLDVAELKPFARIRLIVVDLDGTFILPSTSAVVPRLLAEQRTLSNYRYSISFTIATGRAVNGVQPLLETLSIAKDMPLILYNGAVVVANRTFEPITKRELAHAEVSRILDICSRHPVAVYANRYNGALQSGFGIAPLETVCGWSDVQRPSVDFNHLPVHWQPRFSDGSRNGYSTIVIEAFGDNVDLNDVVGEVVTACKVLCTRSGARYVEIRPPGCNKGVALDTVARSLHIDREEILALGDNDNDSEMLALAGIGVAVRGASASAVKACDFICHRGAVDGALEVIQLVRAARRYFYDHTAFARLPTPSS